MTRKEAKEIMLKLKEEITNDFDVLEDEEKEAFNKAIEALEQEPCDDCDYSEIMDWEQDAKTGKAKPIYWCERHKEPCEDAVSRQAVLDALLDYWHDIQFVDGNGYDVFEDSKEVIDELPSVRPQEPKTGHWIIDKGSLDALYGEVCICSECGVDSIGESNYCPNCRAKMVKSQESEDKE